MKSMPNKLKELVSKKKLRYQQSGFDLDLSYITPRIIAMGFPAQNLEGIYRNHIDDVVSFFSKLHSGHYRIYNLCNERQIDEQKFEIDSINHQYPFNDHNPPMFNQMISCCKQIQEYLELDLQNVVAIQCKAGKGRTGVIVCACLLYQNTNWTATQALEYYGKHRTRNGKGVTIPSQIRFIYYFEYFIHKQLQYKSISLKLNHLVLEEMPNIAGNGYELQFVVYIYDSNTNQLKAVHTSQFYEVKKDGARALKLCSDSDFIISDDLKFQFNLKSKFGKKENLCHCWLNTFFIVHKPPIQSLVDGQKDIQSHSKIETPSNRKVVRYKSDIHDKPNVFNSNAQCDRDLSSDIIPYNNDTQLYKLTLQKHEIDKANKDTNHKSFPFNFAITFVFEDAARQTQPTSPNLAPPKVVRRTKYIGDIHRTNTERLRRSPLLNKITERKTENKARRNEISTNNRSNPDDNSESSESSTKNSHSDLEDTNIKCSSDLQRGFTERIRRSPNQLHLGECLTIKEKPSITMSLNSPNNSDNPDDQSESSSSSS